MEPERNTQSKRMIEFKKDKNRITILVCENVSGKEKFTILFIMKVLRPLCLKLRWFNIMSLAMQTTRKPGLLWPFCFSD